MSAPETTAATMTVIAPSSAKPYRSYLGSRHVLASVARRLCRELHPNLTGQTRIGQVACGRCWERAIRDDERAVVQFDLPRELAADPYLIDPVAVERAARGEKVSLTPYERRLVVALLRSSGWSAELAEVLAGEVAA